MAKMQVFTYDNLTLYDSLLKGYVDAGDAKSLKTVAIEGNTRVGNDSNGGEVMRRTRKKSSVICFVRPDYEGV